jgi:DNA modification methylase
MFIAHMPRTAPPKKPVRYPTKRQLEKKRATRQRKSDRVARSENSTLLKEDSPDSSLGGTATSPIEYLTTRLGKVFHGDSLELLRRRVEDASVDLIMTSPPFGLVRKKDYGNVDAHKYVEWFKQFGHEFHRVLKDTGSLVIDIGGAWISGQPTRSLYHYELLLMLCKEIGFHLAQEFFWWNPARLPTPAEWVTVRRIRVKDAINCVWWLSKTPWPKASNRRVLVPYSDSMQNLLKVGYKAKLRPSGHDISEKFSTDNGAAIPPNLIAIAHTESNSAYMRYCAQRNIKPHPARFPVDLPEYFVRMVTDAGDVVVDPFGGSCVTGEACERLGRHWICCELAEEYLRGAVGRFQQETLFPVGKGKTVPVYNISHPGALWNGRNEEKLPEDGGKTRAATKDKKACQP